MKSIKLMGALLLVLLASIESVWCQENEASKDDYGKVVGSIYDSESNNLLTVKYIIDLVPYFTDKKPNRRDCYRFYTEKNGYFSNKVKSGKYFITFMPNDNNSIYVPDLNSIDYPEKAMIIDVKKGQITKIRKTVYAGGTLKVVLLNNLEQKINPLQYSNNFRVSLYLKNTKNTFSVDLYMNDKEMEAGEKYFFGMIPGEYRIGAVFRLSGYGYKENEIINIENKKETIYKIYIDPNDPTGIQGYIKDQNGNPAVSEIEVLNNNENVLHGYANVMTDKNGFYKIIGLKEGIYKFRIEGKSELTVNNIEIQKNMILIKDIIINIDETSNIK